MHPSDSPPSLASIFLRFLRFGCLAWGGPVAQIGMIKRELVDEEGWIEPARFNRLLAVYQLLPGPEAHELCVHLGTMKRGPVGGLLAGLGFMLPGLILVLLLAWLYTRLDLRQPLLAAAFLGIQVGVVALVVRAVHRIGEHTLTGWQSWAVGLASAAATAAGVSFWITLPAAGVIHAALARRRYLLAVGVAAAAACVAWAMQGIGMDAPTPTSVAQASTLALVLTGLKAGLLTFGGAYTAIPFVRADAVGRGWVSEGQFLDSLALSGIIPAPLIIFATFVGFLAGGLGGALAITAGIFLPAFAFGIVLHDRLDKVIDNPRLHDFLEGVAAAVTGLIAITAVHLASDVAKSVPALIPALLIFAAALAMLYGWKSKLAVPTAVLGPAVLGLLLFG